MMFFLLLHISSLVNVFFFGFLARFLVYCKRPKKMEKKKMWIRFFFSFIITIMIEEISRALPTICPLIKRVSRTQHTKKISFNLNKNNNKWREKTTMMEQIRKFFIIVEWNTRRRWLLRIRSLHKTHSTIRWFQKSLSLSLMVIIKNHLNEIHLKILLLLICLNFE